MGASILTEDRKGSREDNKSQYGYDMCASYILNNLMDNGKIQELFHILSRYNIEKAVLFGSYARGSQSRHSDVDLMLIQKTTRRYFDRYDGIYSSLASLFEGYVVDLLIYTPDELAAISDRKFIQTIMKEGVILYERGKAAL